MTDRYERIRRALEMRPTPGPWEVVNKTDVFTPLGARNAAGVGAAANDGWHIADCDTGPSYTEEGREKIPYAEKQANAALIAACDPDTIRALLAERGALAALAQQPAAVDEVMVKRFLEAFQNTPGDEAIAADEKVARRWLTAALAAQHQEPTT